MKLGIYTFTKILFEDTAEQVSLQTGLGQITVLDHHEPLISLIEPGKIIINKNNLIKEIEVTKGIIHVNPNSSVSILIEK